ncbi:TPA: glycosyl hydrolase [Klebsiella pneumoniae]|nr:glycosyl hydrolase [Klebsiella pneumoniae]HBY6070982.1 glycosyl hydrolase [Klebsiella pneumoniae]
MRNILFWLLFLPLFSIAIADEGKLYGVNIHANNYKLSDDKILELIKQSGFNSFRQEFSWESLEKVKGQYIIQNKNIIKDQVIDKASAYGIKPILILDYGNSKYDNGNYPVTENSITGFVNYARWLASRYKGKVFIYEIWNEWTLGTGMKNKKSIPDEGHYFELVKRTSMALKEIDPNIKVIAGSFNPTSGKGRILKYKDIDWFMKLVQLGILNYIDGVSIHPYSFLNSNLKLRTPEDNYSNIVLLEKKIKETAKSDKEIPIYITEMGVSNFSGNGGVSEEVSADFIVKYTALISTLSYVKGIWWYDLVDDGDNKNDKEHNFGFYKKDLSKKKVVNEFRRLINSNSVDKMTYCNVDISQKRVEFIVKDIDNNSRCSQLEWERIPLQQYNRLYRDFEKCDGCNKISIDRN